METKKCSRCQKRKLLSEFGKNKRSKDGLQTYCKPCQTEVVVASQRKHREAYNTRTKAWRAKNIERSRKMSRDNARAYRFGMTVAEMEAWDKEQGEVCAICGCNETEMHKRTGLRYRLSIDHDHTTGLIRGLLCHTCNTIIGMTRENPNILKSAIAYLEKWATPPVNAHYKPMRQKGLGAAANERNGAHTHPEMRPSGARHGMAKLTQKKVDVIFKKADEGMAQRAIAKLVGVSQAQVQRILAGLSTWKPSETN